MVAEHGKHKRAKVIAYYCTYHLYLLVIGLMTKYDVHRLYYPAMLFVFSCTFGILF